MKTLKELKEETAGFVAQYRERQKKYLEEIQKHEADVADAEQRKNAALASGNNKDYTDAIHDLEWSSKQLERCKVEKLAPFFTVAEHNAFDDLVRQAYQSEQKKIILQMADLIRKYEALCVEMDEKHQLSLSIGRDMYAMYDFKLDPPHAQRHKSVMPNSRAFKIPDSLYAAFRSYRCEL